MKLKLELHAGYIDTASLLKNEKVENKASRKYKL